MLSLIHISEPTRPERISYAVFCLKKNILFLPSHNFAILVVVGGLDVEQSPINFKDLKQSAMAKVFGSRFSCSEAILGGKKGLSEKKCFCEYVRGIVNNGYIIENEQHIYIFSCAYCTKARVSIVPKRTV